MEYGSESHAELNMKQNVMKFRYAVLRVHCGLELGTQ
jgi:hypothetical protein